MANPRQHIKYCQTSSKAPCRNNPFIIHNIDTANLTSRLQRIVENDFGLYSCLPTADSSQNKFDEESIERVFIEMARVGRAIFKIADGLTTIDNDRFVSKQRVIKAIKEFYRQANNDKNHLPLLWDDCGDDTTRVKGTGFNPRRTKGKSYSKGVKFTYKNKRQN